MMPILNSTNFEGMQLIRPMYLIREQDIIAWRDYSGLKFLRCACKFTDGTREDEGKRKKVKQLIKMLAADDPCIEQNIFKSVENVNLSTIIAYKDRQGNKHFFNE